MARLKAEVANLTDAIASGALRSSPVLAAREAALARREASRPAGSVEKLIPRMQADYRELVTSLERILSQTNGTARRPGRRSLPRGSTQALRRSSVDVTDDAIEFLSTQGVEAALARVAGGDQQILMVAGARFGNCLLALPRSKPRAN
jgi:hypothetical protein